MKWRRRVGEKSWKPSILISSMQKKLRFYVLFILKTRSRISFLFFAMLIRAFIPAKLVFRAVVGKKQDDSFLATAIRETEEEIGVSEKLINPVTDLSKLFIPPSNFLVYPFLGFTDIEPDFQPDPSEVQQIIEVKLDYLLGNEAISSQRLSTSYAKNIEVNCFRCQEHIIWGATAMILSELRMLLLNLK